MPIESRIMSFKHADTLEDLAKRLSAYFTSIAMFVKYDAYYYIGHANKYQMGDGNNLWLHPKGNSRYELHWRYFSTYDDEKEFMITALQRIGATDIC